MTKSQLRQIYKVKRLALTPEERVKMSLDIANQLVNLAIWDKKFYHLFLTIERFNEVDTSFILHLLMGRDKHIVISRTDFESSTMSHVLLTDDLKIITNKWGIPEPEDGIEISASKIDVVFVPLLVADKKGYRVGYGKGFYDKFLAECKPDVLKIGLSFFDVIDQIDDVHKYDIPLDLVVIPDNILYLNNSFCGE